MFLLALQGIALYALSGVLWRFTRRFIVKTDLDNVPGPVSYSFWKGNFGKLFNANAWDYHRWIGERFGRVVRINALFGDKQLYVFDPKALHHIVIKDQHLYEETDGFIEGNLLFFGNGLLSSLGEAHKKQRKMLNPVFSIAHMRQMIPIFYNVTHKLRTTLVQKLRDGPQEIDILHWSTRTALELIGQSGLGYSFDTLEENADAHPYGLSVKRLMPVVFPLLPLRTYLLPTCVKIGTAKFRRFIVNILPWKALHQLRDIVDIIYGTSINIFEEKKQALQEGDEAVEKQVGRGKDIMSILMRANMEASDEDKLSESEVIGQMSTFIFAGMDTTSNALSRILHILAAHPEVQEKLRQELFESGYNNKDMSYDELSELPYLDAVCRETLRLYPPIPIMQRITRQDTILPVSTPLKGVNGQEMHEIAVPKDTIVLISILNSNTDPTIWGPDSYEWRPERWLEPLPKTLTDTHIPGIYSHTMTFLGGSRACIGFKFSQLEMKVVLGVLISNFRFAPSDKEIFWEMNPIASPTVKGIPKRPQLPLKMSLVNPASA